MASVQKKRSGYEKPEDGLKILYFHIYKKYLRLQKGNYFRNLINDGEGGVLIIQWEVEFLSSWTKQAALKKDGLGNYLKGQKAHN